MYSGEYQMSEFIVVDDYYVNLGTGEIQGGDTFNTEYGIVHTDSVAGLGTILSYNTCIFNRKSIFSIILNS